MAAALRVTAEVPLDVIVSVNVAVFPIGTVPNDKLYELSVKAAEVEPPEDPLVEPHDVIPSDTNRMAKAKYKRRIQPPVVYI